MISPQEQELRAKLKELRDHIVATPRMSDSSFPRKPARCTTARRSTARSTATASVDDAKALHEEGIEFAPIPVLPDERN